MKIYMYEPVPALPSVGIMDYLMAEQHLLDKNPIIMTLLILIFVDVATGITKSIVTSTTDSSIGKKGFSRHVTIIILMWVLYPLSVVLNFQWVGDWAVYAYIYMYAVSIIENLGQMGLPVPQFLKRRLNKLEEDSLNNEPLNKNNEKGDK